MRSLRVATDSLPRRAIVFCLSVAAAMIFAAAEEALFSVRMEGHAAGAGFAAREAAIQDAKRQVIDAVLGNMMASDDLTPLRSIQRHAADYIARYELIRDEQNGGITSVEIEAQVREKVLQRDAATIMLPRLPAKPKVLVLAGERFADTPAGNVTLCGVAEKELCDALDRLGLEPSGAAGMRDRFTPEELGRVVAGDLAAGQAFARANRADVVLAGMADVTAEPGESTGALLRNKAVLALRVYRGFDGKMTDTFCISAVVRGADGNAAGDQALRDACGKAAGDAAIACVITILGTRSNDTVLFTVENPGSRGALDDIKTYLEASLYIEPVEELYYSPERARLRVLYDGPIAHIVDVLAAHAFGGRKLEPLRVVGREMSFELK